MQTFHLKMNHCPSMFLSAMLIAFASGAGAG